MAEYRGLTIRIGADTGSLTASLKAASSAISAAEKQARSLKKSLDFDPGNKAGTLYLKELQSQLVATSSKARTLGYEIQDIGSIGTKGKGSVGSTIADLAKRTDDAALAARRAKEAYTEVTASLATYYTMLSDFERSLKEQDENYTPIKIDVNNSGMDVIELVYDKMVAAKELSRQEADEQIMTIRRLKASFIDLSNAYDDARLVEQFHNDQVAAANLEAKIRSLSEASADAAKSKLASSLEETAKVTDRLSAGVDQAKARLRNEELSLKLDPSNVDHMIGKISALINLQDALKVKLESVNSELAQLEDAGVDKAAASSASLATDTEAARQAYQAANEEVIRLRSELDEAREVQNSLKANASTNAAAYQEASASVKVLESQLYGAKQVLAETESSYTRLKDANTFAVLSNEAGELSNEIGDVDRQIRSVMDGMADSVKSNLAEALERGEQAIKRLSDGVEQAKGRLENADSLLQFDPTNMDAVANKTTELTNLQEALRVKLDAVNAQLAMLEANGVDKLAASSADLARETEEARARFEDAAEAVRKVVDATGDASEEAQLYKDRLAEAEAEYTRLKDANTYAKLTNDAKALRNEMRGVIDQLAEMSRSDLSISLDRPLREVESLKSETDAARDRFKALDEAVKIDPTNLDLIIERSKALAEAQDKTRQYVEKLKEVFDKLKGHGLEDVVKGSKNLTQEVQDATTQFKRAADNVEDLGDRLAKAVARKRELAEKGDFGDEYQQASETVENLTEELKNAANAANEAKEKMDLLNDAQTMLATSDAMQEANNEMSRLGHTGEEAASRVSTAFYQAMQQVSQFIKSSLTEVIQSSYDLEEAYTDMRKTVDATEEGYQSLKDSAIAASLENPVSADQILRVEALGGQLGFAASELEEFQRVANGLDISTNMSWEDASINMARFFNLMGTQHEELGNYGSAIVDLGNNFATTESEISDMALRIAGVAASMNMSEADVLGLATALTSVGLTAEAGGSSISQIMVKVDKSVANATDGVKEVAKQAGMTVDELVAHINSLDEDGLSEFAKSLGTTKKNLINETTGSMEALEVWAKTARMTSSEFVESWKNEPMKALEALFSGMGAASEEGSNLNLLLEDLGITTIRQSDVARRVANSSERLAEAVSAANSAYRENVALNKEVSRRNESLSGRMDVVKNALTAIKTEFGEGLAPMVEIAASALTNIAKMLDTIPSPIKTAAIALAGLSTVFLAGAATFLAFKSQMKDIVEAIAKLPITSKLAGAGMKLMISPLTSIKTGILSLSGILNPVTLGFGALAAAALVAGKSFYDMQKRSKDFKNAMAGLSESSDKLNESLTYGRSSLKSYSDAIPDTMSVEEITQEIKGFNERVKDSANPVKESNALLSEYKNVIDTLAGKGRASADDMAILEWAVAGLNEALGTNFTAQDILVGKYQDEENEIENLMSYLDRLIEKRQLEAEMNAAQAVYTETLQEQMKLQDNAAASAKKYQDALDAQKQSYLDQDASWFTDRGIFDDAGIEEWLLKNGEATDGLQRLHEEMVTAQLAADGMNDMLEAQADRMGNLQEKSSLYDMLVESFADKSFSWGKALDEVGIDYLDLLNALGETEVGLQSLQAIYSDTSVYFADMVAESGGDLEKLIGIIEEYNATHPETTVDVETSEAEQKIASFKEQQMEGIEAPPIDIIAEDKTAEGIEQARNTVGSSIDDVDVYIKANSTPLQKEARSASRDLDSVKQSKAAEIYANSEPAKREAAAAQAAIDGVSGKTVDVSVRLLGAAHLDSLLAKLSRSYTLDVSTSAGRAAGGLIYHADGYIANHPTWLTDRDIVGEAGAEAVIPLTNRRYVTPFADTVAEQMLDRLGSIGSGTTIEVNLNYTAGDDANTMAQDLARSLGRIMNTRR